MSTVLIALALLVALAVLAAAVREMTVVKLPNDDAAFSGSVELSALTPERVAEIGPLVDRVSVIKIDVGRNRKNPPINADAYEVFIIDVNGAFHDIDRLSNPKQAAEIARRAAERLGVQVDDQFDLLPEV